MTSIYLQKILWYNQIMDNIFKERLRAMREMRGLTQSQLAEKVGIPSTSISHLESGSRKPSFDNLRRLAKFFDISTDYLIGNVDSIDDYAPDALYRDINSLNQTDRDMIENMIKLMKQK